jgi:hypothetical protein
MLRSSTISTRMQVAFAGLTALASALPAAERGDLLQTRVAIFRYTNGPGRAHPSAGAPGLLVAALDLATHARVPICFESAPHQEAPYPPLFVEARNQTVDAILHELLKQDQRYVYRERLGVIEILPRAAVDDPADCLNLVIPELEIHYPWKYAFVAVKCQLGFASLHPDTLTPDPIASGLCSGADHLSHPPPRVLAAHFRRATVRDILDTLAAMAENVAWYATFDGPRPSCAALTLGEYQPQPWYPANHGWTRGLPEKCRNCHYHQLGETP